MKKEGRKSVTKILVSAGSITILVLAAVSFILIPTRNAGEQEQMPEVGSYKGKKIEFVQGSRFFDTVKRYEYEYKNQSLAQGTKSGSDDGYLKIFMEAFSNTVTNLAFTDEVKKSGYVPVKPLVERSMLQYFTNADGVYSPKVFRDTPENTKLKIRTRAEEDLFAGRYESDIRDLKISAAETAFIAKMNEQTRSFKAAFFSVADYPKTEAAEYGKNNAELFTEFSMSVITLENEAEAKKLAQRLKNNELVFSDAVNEYSTKQYSDETGVLRENYCYQLKKIIKSEEAFNTIAELEPSGISDAVETATGFSIFTCTGAPRVPDFSSDEDVNRVFNYMSIYEAGVMEEYFINRAKDFSAQALARDFDSAAREYGAQTAEVPAFPINYGNSPLVSSIQFGIIPQLAEAQSSEHFLTTAFSLAEKEISAPIVLGKNIVVLQLQSIETDERITADILNFYYPQYIKRLDDSIAKSFFMQSPHLKNNVFTVFFKYFMTK